MILAKYSVECDEKNKNAAGYQIIRNEGNNMDIIMMDEKRKQLIYELMIGAYDLEQVQFSESKVVENEFAEGKPCAELYRSVFEANRRLCERLGVDEDKDVEMIINCMNDISRILAMKMYDYGMKREMFDQE